MPGDGDAAMGEWAKGRAPGARWHLNDAVGDSPVTLACGTTSEADAVSWTDPDHHPPEAERCTACQAVFTGAAPIPQPLVRAIADLAT
jgi:hypothetical protein